MNKKQQTSIDAHNSLDPDKIRDMYKRIVEALLLIKQGTYEDIARKMKVDPSRVWKRLSECHRLGLIERTGLRLPLSSGRDGFVWKVTDKAKPLVPTSGDYIQVPTYLN